MAITILILLPLLAAAHMQLTAPEEKLVFSGSSSAQTNLYAVNSTTLKTDGNLIVGGSFSSDDHSSSLTMLSTTAQSVANNNVPIVLTLTASEGAVNLVNNAYMVPATGLYHISYNIQTGTMTTQTMRLNVYKNGVQMYQTFGPAWQGASPVFWSATHYAKLQLRDNITFAAELQWGTSGNTIQITQAVLYWAMY